MRKLLLLLFILSSLSSLGQVDIKIGVNGMKDNSAIMLNAMCNCFGKDREVYQGQVI